MNGFKTDSRGGALGGTLSCGELIIYNYPPALQLVRTD
jgi:hypothetical protein